MSDPLDDMKVSPERRKEMALESLSGIIFGCQADLDRLLEAFPPSRRGTRCQRAIDSLTFRLNVAASELMEVVGR